MLLHLTEWKTRLRKRTVHPSPLAGYQSAYMARI